MKETPPTSEILVSLSFLLKKIVLDRKQIFHKPVTSIILHLLFV